MFYAIGLYKALAMSGSLGSSDMQKALQSMAARWQGLVKRGLTGLGVGCADKANISEPVCSWNVAFL